ncbi:MAG: cobalamin-dependent protein, partial [Treponema sp.]|nr:cobalamin-dependent protein [Treponema sp.]
MFNSPAASGPAFNSPAPGGPSILLTTINAKWIHPSLALRLLKANLGSLEADCEILEFALRQPLAEKVQAIQSRRPRVLGISVSIWNHSATLELLGALDNEWRTAGTCEIEPGGDTALPVRSRPAVVLGGPEVSYLPEEAEIFRRADYVIRGEGEESFRRLCGALAGGENPGGRGPGFPRFINGTPAELAGIRQAYHYYSDEDLSRKLVYVEASRGCPFRCDFCQSAAAGLREFPLEPFLAEMDALIRRGARNFKFLDRSFNADIKRALGIMDFFLRRIEGGSGGPETGPLADRSLCVHFEMVPGLFPPELREKLRRFPPGALRLEIGIQTLNPRVSARINRPGEGEAALELLRFLGGETNATVHADLIAALPGEGIDSFGEGFDRLWLALSGPAESAATPAAPGPGNAPAGPVTRDRRFEIQLGILKLLPGTPMARHTEPYGMIFSPAPPYEALSTAALPGPELDRIKNFARFWEILVNRRPFPELPIAPAGEKVFWRFMELSGRLLARFGRNWGIDRG